MCVFGGKLGFLGLSLERGEAFAMRGRALLLSLGNQVRLAEGWIVELPLPLLQIGQVDAQGLVVRVLAL